METVTVSPKYQIVIPSKIRKTLGLRPGEKIRIFLYGGRLELVPLKGLRKMRGFLKGIDTHVERDVDRL